MSITIDLPAPILAALQEESDATGQSIEQIIIESVTDRYAVFEGEDNPDSDLMNTLRQAYADVDAGRLYTMEEVSADVQALLDAMPDKPSQPVRPVAKAA